MRPARQRSATQNTSGPAGGDYIGNLLSYRRQLIPAQQEANAAHGEIRIEFARREPIFSRLPITPQGKRADLDVELSHECRRLAPGDRFKSIWRSLLQELGDRGPQHDDLFFLDPERYAAIPGLRKNAKGALPGLPERLGHHGRHVSKVHALAIHTEL